MTETAYGIIPFYRDGNDVRVFLIHQYGSGGDTLWTFPKGRGEAGEGPLETALRECREETGLTIVQRIEDSPIRTEYTFVRDGIRVEKVTTYFVGIVEDPAYTIQESEVKEAGWFSLTEAHEKITFDAQKKNLDSACSILDNL